MQIGYLGPLEVRDGERLVDVPGQRLRTLLGRLAVDVGRPVPARTLIEALWPNDAPADPANALQSLVSRLRRTLGDPGLVEQLPGGYRLGVQPGDVDAVCFAQLAAQGRAALASDAQHASATLRQALALWRGEPLPDDDSLEAEAVRARLHETYLQATADRVEADLQLQRTEGGGQAVSQLVAELEQLVADHPLREDLARLRMRALVAAGRPAEALVAYEKTRSYLADTLGSDPSPELQQQYLQVLRLQEAPQADRVQTNLRAAVTSFVGRDADAAKVDALLHGGRLVTVVGAGGAGKTRLASEVAAGWLGRVKDGVWFVELAPVGDAGNLDIAVLDGLGGRDLVAPLDQSERPRMTAHDRVLEMLADANALVVIDNCEHVVDAAAALVADILGSCPAVRLIATSREPLGIDGESLYPLTPLALPAEDSTPEQAAQAPAVRLLLDRAIAAGAELRLNDESVADVVEVVRRLDGLPLAIELAAARLRVMSVAEVATRLGDRFRLLTGGRRTAMPRHRTLRAVVAWSWELLTPLEREIAERFSVFGSGASAAAVAAVCPGADPDDVEDALHALVDKSLLVPVQEHGEARFRMLETLREYGAEQLAEAGTLEQTRAAHASYFASMVQLSDIGLRGRDQVRWLHRLDADRDNVLAALAFLGDQGQAEAALEMSLGLTWFWMLRENGKDASRWLRFALDVPGARELPAAPVAEAMLVISEFAENSGRAEESHPILVALAERLEPVLERHPLVSLLQPLLFFFANERERATALTERNLAGDDLWLRAASRMIRVAFRENDGDVEGMRVDLEHGFHEWQELGDHWGMAQLLASRGQVRTLDGDHTGAATDFEEAKRHLQQLGSTNDDLLVTMRLADLRLRAGDFEGARRLAESLRVQPASPGEGLATFGDGRAAFGDVMLGGIAFVLGDEPTLEAIRQRLLAAIRVEHDESIWYSHVLAIVYGFLAMVAAERGELADARRFVGVSIEHGVRTHDFPILASGGVSLASYARASGADVEAARILGASALLRGSDDATSTLIARLIDALRESLGDAFDAAYEEGRSMGRKEAIARLDPALLD